MAIYKIITSPIGLFNHTVYAAHETGGWGPGNEGGDFKKHTLIRTKTNKPGLGMLFVEPDFLQPREEFKLVVPDISAEVANAIYAERLSKGVHRGFRFDYDNENRAFWFLSDHFDIIRLNEWNQNNVYSLD